MNYLIAGLGNIGAEYSNTRHNIGFMVLDAWAQASNASFVSGRYGSTAEISFKGRKFILLKPSTYMNLSGKAVNYWLQQTKIPKENLLVVVDDLALPFGTLRMRKKGSAGGHNGLKSIDYSLSSDEYPRLRIGIGNGFREGGQVDYVLGELLLEEKRMLPQVLDTAISAIKSFGTEGVERAMTNFNHSSLKESSSSKEE
ncbi:MAG: aminoacyl-tRNA hydrolase [Bacteroidales bacterium]|mgnify:CR=1 FL=1|nr:aminoacyl-tRNA hydrolase [Bacteroidales bacterium]MDD4670517.1 aminoacyl-tRNA hydrolase [Bacteroidales bacterium]